MQSKELMNHKLLYLISRAIEQYKTKHKQNHQVKKLKQSKLIKNLLIAKTLEAFTPMSKFDPFKYT